MKKEKLVENCWKTGVSTQENPVYYVTGCSEIIKDFIDGNKTIFISVGAGIIVFHIIVFSMASFNVCYKRAYNRRKSKLKKRQNTRFEINRIGTIDEESEDGDDGMDDQGEVNMTYDINSNFERNNNSRFSKNSGISRVSTGKRMSRQMSRNLSQLHF